MSGVTSAFSAVGIGLTSATAAVIVLTVIVRARGWITNPASNGPAAYSPGIHATLGRGGNLHRLFGAVAIAHQLEFMPITPALALLIAAFPVHAVGLWEDITHRVSPRPRLFAAVFSGLLACAFAHGVITRLDLPMAGRVARLFAVCHIAFVLHGGWGMQRLQYYRRHQWSCWWNGAPHFRGTGRGCARTAGDARVLAQSVAMIGAILAFLLWNFPRGKVFLGDAGAYFIGFIYAQLSIQLVAHNAGVRRGL